MLTNFAANIILKNLVGRSSNATLISTAVYVGLSTSVPNKDGGNVTEPLGTLGYKRVLLGHVSQAMTQKMTEPANSATENLDIIHFPEVFDELAPENPLTTWGECKYFLIYSAAVGIGNTLLAYEELEAYITPNKGDVPIIRIGDLKITIDVTP